MIEFDEVVWIGVRRRHMEVGDHGLAEPRLEHEAVAAAIAGDGVGAGPGLEHVGARRSDQPLITGAGDDVLDRVQYAESDLAADQGVLREVCGDVAGNLRQIERIVAGAAIEEMELEIAARRQRDRIVSGACADQDIALGNRDVIGAGGARDVELIDRSDDLVVECECRDAAAADIARKVGVIEP